MSAGGPTESESVEGAGSEPGVSAPSATRGSWGGWLDALSAESARERKRLGPWGTESEYQHLDNIDRAVAVVRKIEALCDRVESPLMDRLWQSDPGRAQGSTEIAEAVRSVIVSRGDTGDAQ